ncbi:male-specific histamine-binding salivary protein-like [Ixodes scapularis]|uniref:male-specific histamine-binding salivary protein-like n=1 Tax=Ixodes scapularis TaxID=6945 RepID=UPI001A9ED8A0|nr:male-specific histamine-binding salivary protein-like [Ixodes scapularis]XP_040072414.1 male-specific histamine-binding salivary protein-like [Ixodes scapularis]XP_040072415.1 male-specific histamine-binding salivary protein-like [Ixodes scapularis]
MYPTLLAFASLVAAIASVGSETSSSGKPVDAWTTVTLPNIFYLKYRSYENADGLGGTGECVSIRLVNADQETKTATSTIQYWDAKKSLIKKTVHVTLAPSDGSTGGDTIQMVDTEGVDKSTTKVQFVYSDYGTCDVVIVPGTEEKECELWVSADAVGSGDDASVKKKIAECTGEYDKLCKNPQKHEIYDDTCSSRSKSSK